MDTRSCLCDDVIVALWHMRWQSAFISDVSEDFDATAWPGLTLEMSEESSLKICNANFQVNGNPNFIGKSHPCTIICCLLIFSLQHNPFNLQIWITQACQDLINQYPNLSYPERVSTTAPDTFTHRESLGKKCVPNAVRSSLLCLVFHTELLE